MTFNYFNFDFDCNLICSAAIGHQDFIWPNKFSQFQCLLLDFLVGIVYFYQMFFLLVGATSSSARIWTASSTSFTSTGSFSMAAAASIFLTRRSFCYFLKRRTQIIKYWTKTCASCVVCKLTFFSAASTDRHASATTTTTTNHFIVVCQNEKIILET